MDDIIRKHVKLDSIEHPSRVFQQRTDFFLVLEEIFAHLHVEFIRLLRARSEKRHERVRARLDARLRHARASVQRGF